jgi:hypothetical protein
MTANILLTEVYFLFSYFCQIYAPIYLFCLLSHLFLYSYICRSSIWPSYIYTNFYIFKFLSPTNAPLYYTYKMLKYTVKISHDCSYMFRSIWTIILCWTLLKLQFSAVTHCTAHSTHHSLKHFLPTLLDI